MLELLWLIINAAMVVYIVKTIKEKDPAQKKKKRKIWLRLLGIGAIVAFVGGYSTQKESDQKTEIKRAEGQQVQLTEESSSSVVITETPIVISGDAAVIDKEALEKVGELTSANTEEDIITEAVQKYIDDEYTKTSIDRIEVNPNYGTDDKDDYIALVHLTWNVKNDGDIAKKMLDMYSQDMAVKMYRDLPEISELCVFWTVPFLNNGEAKISFERTGDGMKITSIIFDENFDFKLEL